MSDKKFIFLVIILFLIFILVSSLSSLRPDRNASSIAFSPQTNSEGEVDIKVTPVTLIPNQKPSFKISFDTHSVELDSDIPQNSVLTDNNNSFSNPSWEGSPPGGHHRSGILTFNKPLKKTESISLVLKNISNIQERKFTWNLTN